MENLKQKFIHILRSSEKYTKTDMVYLLSGGVWLTLGQLISSLAAFLTSIAFANLLDPEVFGIYKYILSITSLLTITTLSGMDSAVTQSIARGYEGTLIPGMWTKMRWGVLGSITSFCISGYYLYLGNEPLSIAFGLVAVFLPFTESLDIYNSLLFGKKLFYPQTFYNILKKIISLISTLLTIFLTKNLYIILTVYFLSIILPNLFILLRTTYLYQKNNERDSEAIPYGKKLSAIHIIGLIAGELDKILVFQNVGASQLATFSLAVAPNDQIKGLMKNVNSLAMPQFSQRSIEDIKKTIWDKAKVLFFASLFIIICYIFFAPIFFNAFFPKYLEAIPYSQAIALSLPPVIVAGFLYTVLESQKATREIYSFNTYTNIFNIIILFPLIYFFGIWGAVTARISSRLVICLYSIYLLNTLGKDRD